MYAWTARWERHSGINSLPTVVTPDPSVLWHCRVNDRKGSRLAYNPFCSASLTLRIASTPFQHHYRSVRYYGYPTKVPSCLTRPADGDCSIEWWRRQDYDVEESHRSRRVMTSSHRGWPHTFVRVGSSKHFICPVINITIHFDIEDRAGCQKAKRAIHQCWLPSSS